MYHFTNIAHKHISHVIQHKILALYGFRANSSQMTRTTLLMLSSDICYLELLIL